MEKQQKVYLIDDDKVFVFGVKKMISTHNLCKDLQVFNNGYEAIKHLQQDISENRSLPDVILLDINMPVMDGWDFIQQYQQFKDKIGKAVVIYMVSSSIHSDDIDKARGFAEITDYVSKPLRVDDLRRLLAFN